MIDVQNEALAACDSNWLSSVGVFVETGFEEQPRTTTLNIKKVQRGLVPLLPLLLDSSRFSSALSCGEPTEPGGCIIQYFPVCLLARNLSSSKRGLVLFRKGVEC